MKIILYLFIFNHFNKVFTHLTNNFNNKQLKNLKVLSNHNVKEEAIILRNRRSVHHYQTYHSPSTQNHFTITKNAFGQNAINAYKKNADTTKGYEIIKLTANENPFSFSKHNQIEKHNPSSHNLNVQQYSNNHFSNRNSLNSQTPSFGVRFGSDEENVSSQNHKNSDYKKSESPKGKLDKNLTNETFQYQYNKGWSVHEAISVDNIVLPHLEHQRDSKHSTPNAPEAHYYQKFYDIYNYVEHQTKQDLGQFEKESINDDFNGRSIVTPGQYPHMAAIGFLSNEEKIEFKCGGSLISKIFVITAAHCCYLNGETPIIVKLGIINLKSQIANSDPQRRAIKEIIVHPSYNSTMNYHDIALLKLQSPVEFTKFVRPILLWSSDDIPYERVFTMGYGSTSFAKAPTNILTELSLSLIPMQQCKEILPRDEKAPDGILESQICGRDLEKNRDTCQGDSGGPLQLNLEHRQQRNIYRYYLVGIISYGEFCGSKKPGVYTRISSYCKWIASLVWPNFKM